MNVSAIVATGIATVLDEVVVDAVLSAIVTAEESIALAASWIPVVGAVFAVIGLALMIAEAFVHSDHDPDAHSADGPSPLKTFIEGEMQSLLKTWPDSPEPETRVKVSRSGDHLDIDIVNSQPTARLELSSIEIHFRTGKAKDAIFGSTTPAFVFVLDSQPPSTQVAGEVRLVRGEDDNPRRVLCARTSADQDGGYLVKLTLTGVPSDDNPRAMLRFSGGGSASLRVYGEWSGHNGSVDVVETSPTDAVAHLFVVG